MPPIERIFEVSLYSLLNFLPYILLALMPFEKSLRFSRPVTTLCLILASAVQILLGCLSAFSTMPSLLLSALSTVLYGGFYFLVIRAHVGKIAFLLLMLSNIANFAVSLSKCLEGFFFPEMALENYRWSFSLFLLATELAILIPLFFYVRKNFRGVFEKGRVSAIWRYLWLVPATFYFIWFYHLYAGAHGSSLELLLRPNHSVFLFIVNLGAHLIYHVTLRLVSTLEREHHLTEQNHNLEMQNLQYEALRERIDEARRAKHDVRHHIALLDSYAKAGDLVGLRDYLANYRRTLPDDSSIVFCKNNTVNTVLLYFAQQAKNADTDYDVTHIDLPASLPFGDTELSVLLGNLLENALEAQETVPNEERRITVRASFSQGALLLTVENTYRSDLKKEGNDAYRSTKNASRGIGLSSVHAIAKQHRGKVEISHTDTHFTVTVFLAEGQ